MRFSLFSMSMLGVLLSLSMSCQQGNYQVISDASQKVTNKDGATAENKGAANEGAFLEAVITAINSKDLVKRKQTIHPSYLSCIEEGKDFYESIFLNGFKSEIPQACSKSPIKKLAAGEPTTIMGNNEQACSVSLKAIAANETLLLEDNFSYPVRPTHWLQIQYGDKSKMIQAVQDKGKWFEAIPCAKPETIKKFQEQKTSKEN